MVQRNHLRGAEGGCVVISVSPLRLLCPHVRPSDIVFPAAYSCLSGADSILETRLLGSAAPVAAFLSSATVLLRAQGFNLTHLGLCRRQERFQAQRPAPCLPQMRATCASARLTNSAQPGRARDHSLPTSGPRPLTQFALCHLSCRASPHAP